MAGPGRLCTQGWCGREASLEPDCLSPDPAIPGILYKLSSISEPWLSRLENGVNGSYVEFLGKVELPGMCTIPLPVSGVSLSGFWDVGLLGPPLHHVTLAWFLSPFLQDQTLAVRLAFSLP